MQISRVELDIVRPSGFDRWFNRLIADGLSYQDAFHVLNTLYREKFGSPRYSSYDSYRLSRRKRIKM